MKSLPTKKKRKTGYRMRYQSIFVWFKVDPRTGICVSCGKSIHKGEIKTTQMHHYRYAYKPATVRKNPKLALEHTIELCYGCHPVADALRLLFERKNDRIVNVYLSLPKFVRDELEALAKMILHAKPLNTTLLTFS